MVGVMQFAALGPVGAIDRGEPVHLGGPRHHAVLGVLIAQVGRVVPIDVIVTEVWGDDAGERAIASVHTHIISNLRHVLGKHHRAGSFVDCDHAHPRLLDQAFEDAGAG
jgi:DNA-binding SARP family transcriptional activator